MAVRLPGSHSQVHPACSETSCTKHTAGSPGDTEQGKGRPPAPAPQERASQVCRRAHPVHDQHSKRGHPAEQAGRTPSPLPWGPSSSREAAPRRCSEGERLFCGDGSSWQALLLFSLLPSKGDTTVSRSRVADWLKLGRERRALLRQGPDGGPAASRIHRGFVKKETTKRPLSRRGFRQTSWGRRSPRTPLPRLISQGVEQR